MKDNCCGGISLPSCNNELEILVRQLQREVNKLITSTEARLLCQSKKIDETMVYIKNNLSNALRELLDSMLESGEIEQIITEAISNAISLLEIEVEELNEKVDANTEDINDIKTNSIKFTEYQDSNIDSTFQNIEISHDYASDSIIYITKLRNVKKLSCLPTNGQPNANINNGRISVVDYAKLHDNYKVYINAGMSGINIFDGVVNETTRLDCIGYFGFTADNEMKWYDGINNTITANDLVNDGIVNCIPAFTPIILNGSIYDYTIITNQSGSSEIASKFADTVNDKHPRQLIANDSEGNFYIFSIFGRITGSEGMSYDEMIVYFRDKGFLNVFNLDGGGSTQTVINGESLIYPPQDFALGYRIVPTVIGFQLEEVE